MSVLRYNYLRYVFALAPALHQRFTVKNCSTTYTPIVGQLWRAPSGHSGCMPFNMCIVLSDLEGRPVLPADLRPLRSYTVWPAAIALGKVIHAGNSLCKRSCTHSPQGAGPALQLIGVPLLMSALFDVEWPNERGTHTEGAFYGLVSRGQGQGQPRHCVFHKCVAPFLGNSRVSFYLKKLREKKSEQGTQPPPRPSSVGRETLLPILHPILVFALDPLPPKNG